MKEILYKQFSSEKQKRITVLIISVALYLILNGYRMTNSAFSGDSLIMITNDDAAWQIALGRFIQPILVMLRGGVASPWLISLLSVFWISISILLVLDFFKVNNIAASVVVTCTMISNAAMICSNATYIPWSDFYAFALLMAVLGIWLVAKKKIWSYIVGTLCFTVSLGIYQAYISIVVALVLIEVLTMLCTNTKFKECLFKVLRYVITLVIGAVIYYVVWKIFQKAFHIWTSDSYNGLASVGDYSDTSLLDSIVIAYKQFFYYFANPDTMVTMTFRAKSMSFIWGYILKIADVLILLGIIWNVVRIGKKNKVPVYYWILMVVVLALMPLGFNCISVISKGMVHTLMIYSYGMLYVVSAVLMDKCGNDSGKESMVHLITTIAVAVTIWHSIIFANQVYLKKDMQDNAMQSMMTRIVYEIEHMDGYRAGVTPVAFSGSFETTDYVTDIEGLELLAPYSMGKSTVLYVGADYAYLKYMLNVTMNLTRVDPADTRVQNMPTYPAKGSIAYVDDVVVVKISEY